MKNIIYIFAKKTTTILTKVRRKKQTKLVILKKISFSKNMFSNLLLENSFIYVIIRVYD